MLINVQVLKIHETFEMIFFQDLISYLLLDWKGGKSLYFIPFNALSHSTGFLKSWTPESQGLELVII